MLLWINNTFDIYISIMYLINQLPQSLTHSLTLSLTHPFIYSPIHYGYISPPFPLSEQFTGLSSAR